MSTKFSFCLIIVLAIPIASEAQDRAVPNEITENSTLNSAHPNEQQSLLNDVSNRFDRTHFSTEAKFASKASQVVATYQPDVIERNTKAIADAANKFIQSLNEEQREKTVLKLDDPERAEWTNLPAPPNAGGIRLGELNVEQTKFACDLLGHLLSPQGYEKIRLIMLADDQLLRNGRPRPGFGTENFSLVIFGSPSETEMWSVQFDGHHVGLNVTIHGANLTMAPSFIGTQPVTFMFDDKNIQPMQHEVEAAFILANALTEEQFKEAVVGKRRGQLQAGPGRDNFTPKVTGISCAKLDKQQKSQLITLIAAWVGNLPREHAISRMKEITAEMDEMHFSWQGYRKEGSDVSYNIQSPSLLIEFAYQDLGRDPQNHLHTQYRNPKNDYGKSLLNKKPGSR